MLEHFTGQRDALAPLLVAIASSDRTGRPLPNALFLGGPGRGKTTLARAVAEDMAIPFATLHGSSTIERQSIAEKIMEAKGGILFIDEIHALPRAICEDLYRVIDEGKLSISVPKMETRWKEQAEWITTKEQLPENMQWLWHGPYYYMVSVGTPHKTREVETQLVDVGPITVIGATTDEALLPEPFYSRLSALTIYLRPYDLDELANIARDHAQTLGMNMLPEAGLEVAEKSRHTPRKAKQLTERITDWVIAMYGTDKIDRVDVVEVLDVLGVDDYGLTKPHRDMLAILKSADKGLSRTSLAQMMRIPPKNLELYWGDLSEAGFVTIDTRHRITEEGRNAYEPT